MFKFDLYSIIYDIIAYLVASRSLIDEILYKIHIKRRIDVRNELPNNLAGHVAIVTGGTRGLGLSVVRSLISKGCYVFVASSQTEERFPLIMSKIYDGISDEDKETGVKRGIVRLHHLNLSSIMFAPRQLTEDCFESHLAVNYLGHSLLILELLPKLKETADKTKQHSRIISVSSSMHRVTRFKFEDLLGESNYSSSQAYSQSKLAQIMFTAKLARIIRDSLCWTNVQAFSLHPGIILSELYEHVHIIKYFPFLVPLIRLVTRDIVQGAETTLFAALSPELNDNSGDYLENCAIIKPSKRARDVDDQERLWEVTNRLLSPWLTKSFKLDDKKSS